jgi:CheY-like chemotaxis protein
MTADLIQARPLDILLVEDSEADVKITLRAFKNAKFKNNISVVNDGQECLDFVRRQGKYLGAQHPRPDIILLDINMPKIDGFGVLKALKSDEEYNFIPVIVLSGSKNQDDIMKSYASGANSFIQKPVEYDEFVAVIEGFNFYWHALNKLPGGKE